ncbi:MAG: 3D domain-containing protein, partial [Bacillota bacterium]
PIPEPKPATPSRGESVPRYTKVLTMTATAYCPCSKCNYPYTDQLSYIGLPLRQGIVAVDPNIIPLGTKLYVEGYGDAIAADTGGAIKGNRIDLCFPDHQSALAFGIQNVKVYVLP